MPNPHSKTRALRKACLLTPAALLAPTAAMACSTCFSGAMDAATLTAYYTITALMTGVVIFLMLGFYLFIYRNYAAAARWKHEDADHADSPAPGNR